jgi:hypothetical protein
MSAVTMPVAVPPVIVIVTVPLVSLCQNLRLVSTPTSSPATSERVPGASRTVNPASVPGKTPSNVADNEPDGSTWQFDAAVSTTKVPLIAPLTVICAVRGTGVCDGAWVEPPDVVGAPDCEAAVEVLPHAITIVENPTPTSQDSRDPFIASPPFALSACAARRRLAKTGEDSKAGF